MSVDPKLIHRLFYPQVPAVLAVGHRGRVGAMPVVSYLWVSDSPPLLAVGCNPEAFTCKLALKARSFSLSFLGSSHLEEVGRLATLRGASVRDKLLAVGLSHARGERLAVPVIRGAEATIECTLQKALKLGDHLVLLGRVAVARASPAFKGTWDFRRYDPILYTGWEGKMTTYEVP